MRRRIAYALGVLLTTAGPLYAVDLTGSWFLCNDCSGGGACSTQSQEWAITQTGTNLSIDTNAFDFTGTIDPPTGVFDIPNPPNVVEFHGTGTFSTIDGTYDSGLQSGNIFGGRFCDPMSPACDDGDSCTDDACVNTTVGPCPDLVDVCINTQNGSCTTTTSSSSSTTTTTSTLPLTHHPVTGTKLVLKKSASGKETLIFVTKDPTVYVPPFGGPDDPTTIQTQIDVYSPPEQTSFFDITVPSGMGKPGWQTSPSPTPTYLFKNSTAPAGISKVKFIKLRSGKGLKIVARATGLSMTTPLGAAGIAFRLSPVGNGTPVICAHFGTASVKKDAPPVFTAGQSPAPVNCHSTTLRQP